MPDNTAVLVADQDGGPADEPASRAGFTFVVGVVLGALIMVPWVYVKNSDLHEQRKATETAQSVADVLREEAITQHQNADLYRRQRDEAAAQAKAAAAQALARASVAASPRPTRASRSRRVVGGPDWDGLAQCESSGRWNLNVGQFDGGLQFLPGTWVNYGGRKYAEYAWQATRAQQIDIATKVLAVEGRNAWPGCSAKGAW